MSEQIYVEDRIFERLYWIAGVATLASVAVRLWPGISARYPLWDAILLTAASLCIVTILVLSLIRNNQRVRSAVPGWTALLGVAVVVVSLETPEWAKIGTMIAIAPAGYTLFRRAQVALSRIDSKIAEGGEVRHIVPIRLWACVVAFLVISGATVIATLWLLDVAESAPAASKVASKIEATKTGLSVGLGTGGAVVLLLTARKQWLNEHEHRLQQKIAKDTENDATERRITELFTKAADQLGADHAPVRMAGLYALERLAQANASQRQTVVNVICAYLRMPYTPPMLSANEYHVEDEERQVETTAEMLEELQVRIAAQEILGNHLRPHEKIVGSIPNGDLPVRSEFWSGMSIDLGSAWLYRFSLKNCEVVDANFAMTVFASVTNFGTCRFSGSASFTGAVFHAEAYFWDVEFDHQAILDHVVFRGKAAFHRAKFKQAVMFAWSAFGGIAEFTEAEFAVYADFGAVAFFAEAYFEDSIFVGAENFQNSFFWGEASFNTAKFLGFTGPLHAEAPVRPANLEFALVNHESVKDSSFPEGWLAVPYPDGIARLARCKRRDVLQIS